MKICNSPPRTSCIYQRLARDQAPDEPDNGAQAGAVSQAYSDLYQYLEANNDEAAIALLTHLMNTLTNGGAMDQPMPFPGRPNTGGTMDPAMDSQIRSGRRQASAYSFAQRFPGAARIRIAG